MHTQYLNVHNWKVSPLISASLGFITASWSIFVSLVYYLHCMFSVYMYYTYYSSLESQTVSLLSTHVGKMSDSINVRLSTCWLIQESCLVHVHYVVLDFHLLSVTSRAYHQKPPRYGPYLRHMISHNSTKMLNVCNSDCFGNMINQR